MCSRPNFEETEAELDEALIGLFRRWKAHIRGLLTEDDTKEINWQDEFCICMRQRLDVLSATMQDGASRTA